VESDGNTIYSFGVYKNLDANIDSYAREMSRWGKHLEHEGRFPAKWCIQNGKFQVMGNVNLSGMNIDYPFGVVKGYFYCDPGHEKDDNYPDYIGEIE